MSSITPREMEKIDRLVAEIKQKKLQKENTIELQQLLQHGQDKASKVGDNPLVIGLGLIMAGLIT